MEFFENMKECLQGTQSGKIEIRQNAEDEIRKLRDQDTKKFLATLTREIADDNLDSGSRMMACIIFKNFIINRSAKDSQYVDYWVKLDTEFKDLMKEAIIAQLASPESLVRYQVANVVASIATVEIPRKEWEDLLPNLCKNAEHNDYNIRLASLTTLGYICEEIDPQSIADPVKNRIILALINNMVVDQSSQNLEACRVATKALSNSISFVCQNFKVQHERDYIMTKIFDTCDQSNDEDIMVNCLISLREISTLEYDSIQFYFAKICELTSTASQNPSELIGQSAFEFWTTLIEDEKERKEKNGPCMNYIDSCKDSLIQMVLNGILMVNFEEDEDEDDLGHFMSAGICLQQLSQLIKNDILQPVLAFVDTNIQMDSWKNKYSALIAFGSITEGPDVDKFQEAIVTALPLLVQLYSHANDKIRLVTSWVISCLCENHINLVSSSHVSAQIIPRILNGIKDQPKISNQCCYALEQFAVNLESQDQASNCLTPHFQEALGILLENATRTDYEGQGINTMQASYTTITQMVQNCCSDSHGIVFDLLVPLLQSLEQTLGQSNDKSKSMQENICCALQVCLFKTGDRIDMDYQSKISTLIIQLFSQEGRVTEAGLMAYNGLVGGVVERIDITEMGRYIKHALESNEDDVARLACGIIDDLASNMGIRLVQYLHDFVPCLQNILMSSEIDQKIKLPALTSLGSLALSLGDEFHKTYLGETLSILKNASQASTQIQEIPANDTETFEFLNNLREEIISQYSTIFISVTESQNDQYKLQFQTHTVDICDFLEASLQLQQDQTAEFLGNVATIMMDFALQFPSNQDLKQKLQREYVTQFITKLNDFGDEDSKELAISTFNAISAMQ